MNGFDFIKIDLNLYLTVYYLTNGKTYSSNIVVLKGNNVFPDCETFKKLEYSLNNSKEQHLQEALELINSLLGYKYDNIEIIEESKLINKLKLSSTISQSCLWSFPNKTELIVNGNLAIEIKPDQIVILENICTQDLKFKKNDSNDSNGSNLYHVFRYKRPKLKLKLKLKKTLTTIA